MAPSGHFCGHNSLYDPHWMSHLSYIHPRCHPGNGSTTTTDVSSKDKGTLKETECQSITKSEFNSHTHTHRERAVLRSVKVDQSKRQ